MYEVEVKVPADLDAVRDRLGELDATSTGAVVQADTYYDAPHRSFPDTDEALRIRREHPESGANESRITYKGPLLDDESKSREEVETGVDDGEKLDRILTSLGFEPAATVSKERDRYAIDHGEYRYTITLDVVDSVGEYVEVEADVETERDVESAREGAYAVLDRLGLDPEDQLRTSYLGLLLAGK